MKADGAVFSFGEDVERLADMAGEAGWPAAPDARGRLVRLAETISGWNDSVNLVSRKDIARLVSYHFCDSASVLPVLGPQAGPTRDLRVLDVGGSNGLPSLVLATLAPGMRLTICESRQKRRGFLETVCAEIGQGQVDYEIDRVDGEGFGSRHSASFDLIVARAVTRFRLLAKWCLPLLKAGGRLVAYKGSRSLEEVGQAQAYWFGHGGSDLAVVASPWAAACNPLRLFMIGRRG
ncbi:MAG: 16S rRNA (guanine(527)-N(7))-methyltransferase RsmG [bacterium]